MTHCRTVEVDQHDLHLVAIGEVDQELVGEAKGRLPPRDPTQTLPAHDLSHTDMPSTVGAEDQDSASVDTHRNLPLEQP